MRLPLSGAAWLALCALALAAPQPPQGKPPVRFRISVLDSLGSVPQGVREEAVAINERGETVGSVCYGHTSLAAHWSPKGDLTLLSTPQSGEDSFARDINAAGVVIGYAIVDAAPQAFQWTANSGKVPLALASRAVPLAINDAGLIGYTYPSTATLAAALWSSGSGTVPIGGLPGDLLVRDVSAEQVVTGIAGGGELPARAFRWTPGGGMVELGVPSGFEHSHANAISAKGLVVGLSRAGDRDQATRWESASGPVLLDYVRSGHQQSTALGVNAKGWVVGFEYPDSSSPEESFAVLWIDDVPYDINSMLSLPGHEPDLRVTCAFDVNNKGQVAARGMVYGEERALRLDPE